MSKHTKGPWKVGKPRECIRDGNLMYGIIGPETVTDYEDWGFTEANARLIAAAPDLLEALKLADAMLSGANMNAKVVEKKVRAAIAKAEAE